MARFIQLTEKENDKVVCKRYINIDHIVSIRDYGNDKHEIFLDNGITKPISTNLFNELVKHVNNNNNGGNK